MAKAMTTAEFIRRAEVVHGDAYDYGCTSYINMQHKVMIRCRTHGVFEQMPQAHLRGQGCPVCGREKQKQTMLDRYGVDNPMKSDEFFQKARETCVERYGHAWARSSDDVQARTRMTNMMRRGVAYPLQDVHVMEKLKNTVRVRYGVDSVSQDPDIRARAKATCLAKYGSEEPLAAKSVRDKIIATNRERYGGMAPLSSAEIRGKCEMTVFRKYGVQHVTQLKEIQHKILESKREHGTFGTSACEDVLYGRLCEAFGRDDVIRQYKSDAYPFACDFYVKSRDLYIELNASWTHGSHWFDPENIQDAAVVNEWLARGTAYYKNAVRVWTVADVNKRNHAKIHDLNYVVFWDYLLADAFSWFDMGCPDGHDWERVYSWAADR